MPPKRRDVTDEQLLKVMNPRRNYPGEIVCKLPNEVFDARKKYLDEEAQKIIKALRILQHPNMSDFIPKHLNLTYLDVLSRVRGADRDGDHRKLFNYLLQLSAVLQQIHEIEQRIDNTIIYHKVRY